MDETKRRKVWEDDVKCVACGASNHVKVEKEIIIPAEPADTKIIVTVEKTNQATLD